MMSKESILNDTANNIVESAVTAAMMTNRISMDFKMSVPALEQLCDAIEKLQKQGAVDELYGTVLAYILGYNNGWIDSQHPNKKMLPYSDLSE